jgi:hypothetical protein
MTNTMRSRGRPKGATRFKQEDAATLEKMAALIVGAVPPIKPTAAMRKLGFQDRSTHKRLMRKWTSTSERLMAVERERRAQAQRPAPVTTGAPLYPDYFSRVAYAPSLTSELTASIFMEVEARRRNAVGLPMTAFEREQYLSREIERRAQQQRMLDEIDRRQRMMDEFNRHERLMKQVEEQERIRRLVERPMLGRYGF